MNLANDLFGGLTGTSKAPKARGGRQRGQQTSPKGSPALVAKLPQGHTRQVGAQESTPQQQPVQSTPKPQVDLLLDLGVSALCVCVCVCVCVCGVVCVLCVCVQCM